MNEAVKQATGKLPTFRREQIAPGAYTLDLSAVKDEPVKENDQPSTFGQVYVKLRDSKIEKMPSIFGIKDKFVTDKGDIEVDCDWPLKQVLRKLIDFTGQGIDPHRVTWFYFANDWSRDADVVHCFFAVHDGKIVDESCNFSSTDALILKRKEDDDPIWHSKPYFDEAWDAYWYRKFYTETLTGQLMVLRPDEPILYHYERPTGSHGLRELQYVTILKAYRLLWVALPLLAAIAFPAYRLALAIVAALLLIDLLWRCWATRKIGQ